MDREDNYYLYIINVSTLELLGLVVKLPVQEHREDIGVVYITNVPTEKENRYSINTVGAKSIEKTIAVVYVTCFHQGGNRTSIYAAHSQFQKHREDRCYYLYD